MCELLGMCFSRPVTPSISFLGFRSRGEINRHGWGVAFYPDESVQVIKEPINASASRLSNFLKDYPNMRSRIVMAHVRHATVGSHTRKNTHPFERELVGRDYVCAHNGTLRTGFRRGLPLGAFKPIGDTDSEHAFCYLLQMIRKRGEAAGRALHRPAHRPAHGHTGGAIAWHRDDFRWLHSELGKINRFGYFNCLLSDGEHLFAYRGFDAKRELHFVNRVPPYGRVRLLDRDFEIDLESKRAGMARGVVVATTPLTDEAWVPLAPGHLMAFKDGKTVFSQTI